MPRSSSGLCEQSRERAGRKYPAGSFQLWDRGARGKMAMEKPSAPGDQPCVKGFHQRKREVKMKKNHCMLIYYQAVVTKISGKILKKYYISKRLLKNLLFGETQEKTARKGFLSGRITRSAKFICRSSASTSQKNGRSWAGTRFWRPRPAFAAAPSAPGSALWGSPPPR